MARLAWQDGRLPDESPGKEVAIVLSMVSQRFRPRLCWYAAALACACLLGEQTVAALLGAIAGWGSLVVVAEWSRVQLGCRWRALSWLETLAWMMPIAALALLSGVVANAAVGDDAHIGQSARLLLLALLLALAEFALGHAEDLLAPHRPDAYASPTKPPSASARVRTVAPRLAWYGAIVVYGLVRGDAVLAAAWPIFSAACTSCWHAVRWLRADPRTRSYPPPRVVWNLIGLLPGALLAGIGLMFLRFAIYPGPNGHATLLALLAGEIALRWWERRSPRSR
ncbi:hypothetical protein GALL_351930 [mine drainage metagenome]|uniref:Uncharacterized protein n=1 Tax=mine drainage metagenome TaxID=410659 RepID=A0A1J5R4A5_9ZZZZ